MQLPLFIHVKYIDIDGNAKELEIQTKSLGNQKQDAKIGNFNENFWFRPRKAVKSIEYKTFKDYKTACTLSIKKMLKARDIRYYTLETIDGVEYEKAI